MRLIDADALIDVLAEMQGLCQTKAALVQNSKIWQQVKDMPTIVQPERKKGKWIRHDEIKNVYGGICIECSECGEKYVVQHILDEKYCRNCGADMRGEQDE